MIDEDAIEQWAPDAHRLHLRVRLSEASPLLSTLGVFGVLLVAIAAITRESAPVAMLSLTLLPAGLILAVATLAFLRTPPWLAREVRFELLRESVRVRAPFGARETHLASIESVDVHYMSARRDLGHVLLRARGEPAELGPAIPTGRRVSAGSAGLVTWASVEQVNPADQLFEGTLTFWFVVNPDDVARRVRAAVDGVATHSRGPHR
jgi:hypothetical protein